MLVLASLLLASLACYSGQIPGVFELTPYHTPTPMPVAQNAKFQVLDEVLVPQETGRIFFNLTVKPEALQDNLMNSRGTCQGDTSATVLYAGQDEKGDIYYLLDCRGSTGWSVESRLAGPLEFSREDLAMTLAPEGQATVPMLDETMFQPMPAFMATCKPGAIAAVSQIQPIDPDKDGIKDLYYLINCPTGSTSVRGWVSSAELFGPLEINIGQRALALTSVGAAADTPYALASEPAPVSEGNAVTGECFEGSILETQEAVLADNMVYYKVSCGDMEGWTDQSRFVGPLIYDPGTITAIYVPPIPVFEDELPTASAEGEPVAEGEGETETAEPAAEGDTSAGAEQRKVVEYTPPLYLTDKPGPAIVEGENANTVGQCVTGTIAQIEAYAAVNTVYYQIQCDECVQSETDDAGSTTCLASETRNGWVEQQYLQGPLAFAQGDKAQVKSSSKAIEVAEDGTPYVRLPANEEGASLIGQFTEFTGRCPLDEGVEISGVILEKARTSSRFTFYYQVTCLGQAAKVETVTVDGRPKPQITYDNAENVPVIGILSGSDLEGVNP
jgi:hypothetical protein